MRFKARTTKIIVGILFDNGEKVASEYIPSVFQLFGPLGQDGPYLQRSGRSKSLRMQGKPMLCVFVVAEVRMKVLIMNKNIQHIKMEWTNRLWLAG